VQLWAKDYDKLSANLPPSPCPPQRTRAGHEERGAGGGFRDNIDVQTASAEVSLLAAIGHDKAVVEAREDSRQKSAKLATIGGKTTRLSMLFLPLFAIYEEP
jgi:hypothetical protein